MNILSIETSCDETAVAVVADGTTIISSCVASSSHFHEQFGGILPELASRKQLEYMLPVLTQALTQAFPDSMKNKSSRVLLDTIQSHINAIAVTQGPGLIGSLLVGVETAKTLASITQLPLIPVNHVVAHIYANMVNTHASQKPPIIQFPAISLVTSGGHTELFLLRSTSEWQWIAGTIDDAAGEAFDKTARLLGFHNRGGLAIQEAAKNHDPQKPKIITLPRPLIHEDTLNFSFSGLKTAVANAWKQHGRVENSSSNPMLVAAFAYEIQEAITDVLLAKTLRAAKNTHAVSILLSGGVASNVRLREKFSQSSQAQGITLRYPPIELCTDNAVVIGSYAFFHPHAADWHNVSAIPNLSVEHQFPAVTSLNSQ